MGVTRVNSASISGTGTTSAVATIPNGTGILAGDLIIVSANCNGTHVANGMSVQDSVNATNYTTIKEQDLSSASSRWLQTFFFVTPVNIADGSTVTLTAYAGSAAASLAVDIFRGVTGTISNAAVGVSPSAGSTCAAPALAAAPPATNLVLSFCSFSSNTATLTVASPFTAGSERLATTPAVATGYVLSADGVSTYGVTWTNDSSQSNAAITVAFASAAAGPGVFPAQVSSTWTRQFRHRQALLAPPPATPAASPPPPGFIDPAGSRPRYPQPFRRGEFFSQPWGQGNQGTQFPQFLQQAQTRRLTLRRSEGQFFSPGQFNEAAPQLPSFPTQAGSARRITRTVRPARGQFFNQAWGQGNQGIKFPLFMRQAGSASRWTLRRSHGTFFNQSWGQANQGIQFPLYLRQSGNASRDTLRRSQGHFANPGQFNLANQAYPSFTRQSGNASRWTLRRSHGIFFQQAWGQANQGVQFPLYMRQAQSKRLTLRRSEGNYFSPGQFNLSNQAYPSFTRQPQLSRETLRRSHGTFFNQAWGQANRGIQFPLFMRQAGNASRFTLRSPRGRFVPIVTTLPAVPPPQFITRQQRTVPLRIARGRFQVPGLGQANQGVVFPLFTRQAQLSRQTLRRSSGKFTGVPSSFVAVPPPQFLRQSQLSRETLRRSRGTFSGNVFPQANQGTQFPLYIRQAESRRLGLRRSEGNYFSPAQFNLTASQVPQFIRQGRRILIRVSRGRYFSIVTTPVPSSVPTFLTPKRPKLSSPRRGKFSGIPKTAVIPVYPPDFRTTRRVNFTRLDKSRRGTIIQLVPFQKPSAPGLTFKLNAPAVQWVTGSPFERWRVS